MKMVKSEATAPAMHTILQCRKGVLKRQFQKIAYKDSEIAEDSKDWGHRKMNIFVAS